MTRGSDRPSSRLRSCAKVAALSGLALLFTRGDPGAALGQPALQSRSDCGAAICIQTGISSWRYEAEQYCESSVCLRDTLAELVELDWDRMTAGQRSLFASAVNPYRGLAPDEYRRLRGATDIELAERVALLAKITAACIPAELKLRLDVPGYDLVEVTFQIPLADDEAGSGFQVAEIRRTYRTLPGGSVGWWIRWISNRLPGITLLDGEPKEFASYEIGLYMGGLVLHDIELEAATPEAYADQAFCRAG